MRLRLLRRRLTISAPRMAVRSALPWPLRWVVAALVFGFCAAIALWAFEFGREIAGLDGGAAEELTRLKSEMQGLQKELQTVKDERDKAQSIANTASTLLTAEKAAQTSLLAQNRQLEANNQALRADLGFFEQLIPAVGAQGIAIRGLQAERIEPTQLKWQVMVMQSGKKVSDFNGRLEVSVSGQLQGKPWSMDLPEGPKALAFAQYGRLQGVLTVPAQAMIKLLTVKVMEGEQIKATQSVKLP